MWAAHVGDVIVFITHIFNGERDDFQSHLLHIGGDGLEHLRSDVFRVFHQVFDGQLANNTTQVTFHHQADQVFAHILGLTEELLGGGLHALFIGTHFDLCHSFNVNGNALCGVEVL